MRLSDRDRCWIDGIRLVQMGLARDGSIGIEIGASGQRPLDRRAASGTGDRYFDTTLGNADLV